jgi:hypothetical protein
MASSPILEIGLYRKYSPFSSPTQLVFSLDFFYACSVPLRAALSPTVCFTCPAMTTQDPAGKGFSPRPHAGCSAAEAGSGASGVGRQLIKSKKYKRLINQVYLELIRENS